MQHKQRVSNRLNLYVALATMLVAGCSDTESRTDLNPEGPPMIRQVRLYEKYMDGAFEKQRRVFAFGTHEDADEVELASTRPAGMVTTASALNGATGNNLRIIVDELLIGNYIEEVACRGPVTATGANLGRVPVAATPEDVARCAAPDDVLGSSCKASNPRSMCICQNPAGCVIGVRNIPMGQPVGVLDIDQDGAPDDTRMIPGVVQLRCGSNNVAIDLDNSYWNPSGDQNRPALGGFEALGPAIVLTPSAPLPTNLECTVVFADGTDAFPDIANPGSPLPAITDKQNEKVCAPTNGDVTQSCTQGDTTAIKFKVEPFRMISDSTIFEGATINRNIALPPAGQAIDIVFNVPVKADTIITGITFSPALPADATKTIVGAGNMARTVRITGPTPLPANTMYTATINTVTDTYGQPLQAPVVIHFSTGA